MKRKKYEPNPAAFHPVDILIGLAFLLAFIGIGLTIALFFKPLYYWNIGNFGIEAESGLSRDLIKANYDSLIHYCSPFYFGEFKLATLPASPSGISHFEDCKPLFNGFFIAGFISAIACGIAIWLKRKNRQYGYLLTGGITALVLPVVVGIFAAINFDKLFVLFHKIAFSNDDWLFDPVTDPIINLLPEEFFMLCAFVIVGTIILGSIILIVIFAVKNSRKPEKPLLQPKKNYVY